MNVHLQGGTRDVSRIIFTHSNVWYRTFYSLVLYVGGASNYQERMKHMNTGRKVSYVILALSFILGFYVMAQSASLAREMEKKENRRQVSHPYFPPFSDYSTKSDLHNVNSQVDFDVKLPTKLGAPDEIRLSHDKRQVLFIYTMGKIEDSLLEQYINSSNSEPLIRDAGGIVYTMWRHFKTYRQTLEATRSNINSEEELVGVDINGYLGSMGGDDAHLIYWSTEAVICKIGASVEFDYAELLEIARSVEYVYKEN